MAKKLQLPAEQREIRRKRYVWSPGDVEVDEPDPTEPQDRRRA